MGDINFETIWLSNSPESLTYVTTFPLKNRWPHKRGSTACNKNTHLKVMKDVGTFACLTKKWSMCPYYSNWTIFSKNIFSPGRALFYLIIVPLPKIMSTALKDLKLDDRADEKWDFFHWLDFRSRYRKQSCDQEKKFNHIFYKKV